MDKGSNDVDTLELSNLTVLNPNDEDKNQRRQFKSIPCDTLFSINWSMSEYVRQSLGFISALNKYWEAVTKDKVNKDTIYELCFFCI